MSSFTYQVYWSCLYVRKWGFFVLRSIRVCLWKIVKYSTCCFHRSISIYFKMLFQGIIYTAIFGPLLNLWYLTKYAHIVMCGYALLFINCNIVNLHLFEFWWLYHLFVNNSCCSIELTSLYPIWFFLYPNTYCYSLGFEEVFFFFLSAVMCSCPWKLS